LQALGRPAGRPARQRFVTLTDELLGPVRVDRVRRNAQRISRCRPADRRVVTDYLAQPRDVGADGRRRSRRGLAVPKLVGESIGRDGFSGLEQQQREQRLLPGPAEGNHVPAADRLYRPKQPEFDGFGAAARHPVGINSRLATRLQPVRLRRMVTRKAISYAEWTRSTLKGSLATGLPNA
jgi:hypothetical protein